MDRGTMFGLVQTAWLFICGLKSVRIVRVANANGRMRLLVQGPGTAVSDYEFDDVIGCMTHQAEIERTIVAKGFQLERFTRDRRRRPDRRHTRRGPDRRGWTI